jgi:hypothetical protein
MDGFRATSFWREDTSVQAETMQLSHDMSQEWRKAVSAEEVRAKLERDDGTSGWWGIEVNQQGAFDYYIEDQQSRRVRANVRIRQLAGGLRVQYHPFRESRPGFKKPSVGRQADLASDSWSCRFGCQDPRRNLSLLARQYMAQFMGRNAKWNAYINASPFHPKGHFIWVQVFHYGVNAVLPHTPQRLARETLQDFVGLANSLSNALLFFNSLHAGATVNHLHFQLVFYDEPLAIVSAERVNVGRLTLLHGYPATGLVFERESVEQVWSCVDVLQESKVPFNLIAVDGTLYLFPRNADHEVVEELPGGVVASMELAGMVITGQQQIFDGVTDEILARALNKVTLSPAHLVRLLNDVV